jgi:hypothetical protein
LHELHLHSSASEVTVRLREFNGRWIASADTPDGPTVGWGMSAIGALWMALEPFGEFVEELLQSVAEPAAFWEPR